MSWGIVITGFSVFGMLALWIAQEMTEGYAPEMPLKSGKTAEEIAELKRAA